MTKPKKREEKPLPKRVVDFPDVEYTRFEVLRDTLNILDKRLGEVQEANSTFHKNYFVHAEALRQEAQGIRKAIHDEAAALNYKLNMVIIVSALVLATTLAIAFMR